MTAVENSSLNKLKNLFHNYWLMLASYFLFFAALGLLSSIFPEIDFEKYKQTGLFQLMENNPLKFAFLAVIGAPIIEEALFRSLVVPSQDDMLYFICAVLGFGSFYLMPEAGHWLLKITLLGLSLFIIFLFLKSVFPPALLERFCNFFHRYYRSIWFISAFLFGLVHIWNYIEGWEFNLLLFLLIFPRFIAGFFFGKVKIENRSLIWPILMHAMNNGIIVLFTIPEFL